MKAKKFLAVLVLVILSASSAYAKITEQQAMSDQRFQPFVEFTKQEGEKCLSGRYYHVKEILSRTGKGEKINAASSLIIEIGKFDSETDAYPANFDVYGENLVPVYMTFDTSGTVPILRTYAADDEGNYEMITEDFAVVYSEKNSFVWCLGSVETGEVRYMFPLNKTFLPDNWYEGKWSGADGSQVTLEDGKISSNGNYLGTFIISDNRIAVKTPDGERDVIFCAYNPDNESLVMTFTSGPNGMGENASVYVQFNDEDDEPEVKTKTSPVFKAPKKPAPKFPTQNKTPDSSKSFPKFPGKQKISINIEGVWEAMVNGQQVVLQAQGNRYYMWINTQPYEMGTFQIEENILSGVTNTGTVFENILTLDKSGNVLTMTDSSNGASIVYRKMK